MHHHAHILAAGLALSAASCASAQPLYDFAPVTALAQGALAGQNVTAPVPGFDLLLMKDGRVVYHQSFGNWSLNRAANADSATKTISGAVIMSLVDSNSSSAALPFTLNTRLSDYIPAFSGPAAAITISQAFSHTSGIANSNSVSDPAITLQQAAAQIAAAPLVFNPGTRFSYGGTSMHAAGAVAELAAQRPWNQLFQQRLATPLNLTATRYVLSGPQNPRIGGGCESNATEFGRVMEMLRTGGLGPTGSLVLSSNAVAQLFTRQTPDPILIINTPIQTTTTDRADYGVGVWLDVRDANDNLIGALAAGARGFSAWIDFPSGMVGVFATDTTSSGGIQQFLYLVRDAAAQAVRTPRCYANCDGSTGAPSLTPADFTCFLNAYRAGTTTFAPPGNAPSLNPAILAYANCDNSTTIPSLTPADFTCFLARYRAGCP